MKGAINLFWYRHKEGKGNFGDELNPYIIERITNQKTNFVDISFIKEDFLTSVRFIAKNLFYKRITLADGIKYLFWNIKRPKVLLSIGSILQYSQSKRNIVWGSGIISSDAVFCAGNFLAVRGPYTQQRVKELGYISPKVVGDPALLLPLIFNPKEEKKHKVGIIPHHIHYRYLRDNLPNNILVIDLLDDIENVINQINSCEITLSTSLHGIIVSHCYGIPSIWTNFSEIQNKLYGDDIKFRDYFASVDLPEYKPLNIRSISTFDTENILSTLNADFSRNLLPDKKLIEDIQKNLLSVAPFVVKQGL